MRARRGKLGRMRRARQVGLPKRLSVEYVDDDLAVFSWDAALDHAPVLTDAERDVLSRIVDGAANAEIARARGTSVRTVANQVAALLRKLGVGSRYDLIRGRRR